MDSLKVGDKINIEHIEGVIQEKYVLRVEVREIFSSAKFAGRVEHIFAINGPGAPGEIMGGEIHQRLIRQEMNFKHDQIAP